MEIFLQRGLDDPNQIEPKGEFFIPGLRQVAHPEMTRLC
jgi:hypothetical protein